MRIDLNRFFPRIFFELLLFCFTGKKLFFEGFGFYRHSTSDRKIHWRCCNLGVQCVVRLHTDTQGNVMSMRGDHNELCCKKNNLKK